LRWLGRTSLALLAAVLPFELVRPVAPLGPLQLSSVELFLYATVALWAAARGTELAPRGVADRARRPLTWWRRLPEAQRAAAVWAVVLLISALVAPIQRPAALKFALRSLGGVALFVAAADLLDSRQAISRTLIGLAIGATIGALLMALEVGVAGVSRLLRPFHAQTFGVLGLARASGPFQYPNIAAMYLEAALPAVVAAGVVAAGRAAAALVRWVLAATVLVALLVEYALVLAASRAGLVTALVGLIGVAALARSLPTLRRLSIGLAGSLLALTLIAQAVSPLLALRLRFWEARSWYGSAMEPAPDHPPLPAELAPGSETQVALSLTNTGALMWPAGGPKPVRVSYHWMSQNGLTLVVLDGVRTVLSHDVATDATIDLMATVRAPDRPGLYTLWWDLVHEGVTWFSDAGDPGSRQRVAVGVKAPPRKGRARDRRGSLKEEEFSRTELWRAGFLAFREHPLLGLGPDNFRHAYGSYLGRTSPDDRLHANNFYIEVLSTLGIVGLGALVLVIVALARTARRAARAPLNRVLVFGVGGALVAYLVHGTLDYFLEFTPTYALLWLLAGALVALERLADRDTVGRGIFLAPAEADR
jgi:hypothetical protein